MLCYFSSSPLFISRRVPFNLIGGHQSPVLGRRREENGPRGAGCQDKQRRARTKYVSKVTHLNPFRSSFSRTGISFARSALSPAPRSSRRFIARRVFFQRPGGAPLGPHLSGPAVAGVQGGVHHTVTQTLARALCVSFQTEIPPPTSWCIDPTTFKLVCRARSFGKHFAHWKGPRKMIMVLAGLLILDTSKTGHLHKFH